MILRYIDIYYDVIWWGKVLMMMNSNINILLKINRLIMYGLLNYYCDILWINIII